MPKVATAWRDQSGTATATNSSTTDYLTTEASDFITTEASDYLILTTTTMTDKENTLWDDVTKSSTAWKPRGSGTTTVFTTDQYRITENSTEDLRLTESGDFRILQESTVIESIPTEWTDA
jgi:hypothetical protein